LLHPLAIVNLLKPGTTLLHKYRIERLRLRSRDVILYEATDAIHHHHVCIKVIRRDQTDNEAFARFQLEARGPNVIDVGTIGEMHFVVVSEWQRRTPRRPPPLPARARKSKPPPLPVPIPIDIDEVALEASPPPVSPPPPPISQPETVFERTASQPARRSAAWPWVALVVAAALTGAGGWYVGYQTSRGAPAAIAPTLPSSETKPELAPPPIEEKTVVEPIPTQTDAITAPTTPAAPAQRPPPTAASASSDPLTI